MNVHVISRRLYTCPVKSVHQRPINGSKLFLWPYMECVHNSEGWYTMRLQFLTWKEMKMVLPQSFSWILCASAILSNLISVLLSNVSILLTVDTSNLLIPSPQICPSQSFLSWWMATSIVPECLCGSLEAEFLVFALKEFQLIVLGPPTPGRVVAVHKVYWFKCWSQLKKKNKQKNLTFYQLNNMASPVNT